jgi:hypothetical protein
MEPHNSNLPKKAMVDAKLAGHHHLREALIAGKGIDQG